MAYITDRPQKSNSGAEFQRLVLWEPGNKTVKVIPVEPQSKNLIYNPSGTLLAFRMGKNSMRVLDADSLKPVLRIPALSNSKFEKAKFSLDGKRLIVRESHSYRSGLFTAFSSGFRVWDIASKNEIARLDGKQMVQVPGTTEIALRNHQGWQAWDVVSGDLNKKSVPKWQMSRFSSNGVTFTGRSMDKAGLVNVATGEIIELQPEQKDEKIGAYGLSEQGNADGFSSTQRY